MQISTTCLCYYFFKRTRKFCLKGEIMLSNFQPLTKKRRRLFLGIGTTGIYIFRYRNFNRCNNQNVDMKKIKITSQTMFLHCVQVIRQDIADYFLDTKECLAVCLNTDHLSCLFQNQRMLLKFPT